MLIDFFMWVCATIRIATKRCMDLHSLWKVYVRTPLGFRSISVNSRPFCKGTPRNFIGFPWTCVPLGFPWICIDFARATLRDFIRFLAIHGASKTCLDAAPLDQRCEGNEIKYLANRDEGGGAAGSAWCPQSPGHTFPHITTSDS